MLNEVLGVERVESLYLQLLYSCNFRCDHCFHGERLEWGDRLSRDEVRAATTAFLSQYGTGEVVLLGGEPFLHPDFVAIVHDVSELGLDVDVCTNGYRIGRRLKQSAEAIRTLRVSFEGLADAHDAVRRPGSFEEAIRTIRLARSLDVNVGATVTVTSTGVKDIVPLARLLAAEGVSRVKFHQLRLLGNAAAHPELEVGAEQRPEVVEALSTVRDIPNLTVEVDQDLEMNGVGEALPHGVLDRVEIQPTGEAYMSCKAVGSGANAFQLDRLSGHLIHVPSAHDEVAVRIEDVVYR